MSKYRLLSELLPHLAEYEKTMEGAENATVEGFAFWLNNVKSEKIGSTAVDMDFSQTDNYRAEQGVEVMISKLISHLYKYAKSYTKKVLMDTPLHTLDDFGYLASLMIRENMSKSDLIHQNINEITSGTDVLKRLLTLKLIEEFNDESDKRKKLVRITPEGRILMIDIFNRMNPLSHLVCGNLTNTEKQYLYNIMQKLDAFHRDIKIHDGKAEIEDVLQKYVYGK